MSRPTRGEVRVQSALLVAGGYLLPDLTLVAPLPRSELPTTAHLVIEVAQASQARDADKARDYAVADVPECWIVDLLGRAVVVHRHPLAGAYQEFESFGDGASIKPLLASLRRCWAPDRARGRAPGAPRQPGSRWRTPVKRAKSRS